MLKTNSISYQPSSSVIYYNRCIKYIRVGWMLHIACVISLWIAFMGFTSLIEVFSEGQWLSICLYVFISSFGFSVFVISVIDAYGRFQNYKQTKDLLYQHGFDKRLVKPFVFSRCQRNAVLEAAKSTDCHKQVAQYYFELGYRWFHIFPDAFTKNPLVLLTSIFWKRILVTKHYKQQYFYW